MTHSKIMLLISTILFFLAAITEMGADIVGVPALAWAFFAFCAWILSMVIP